MLLDQGLGDAPDQFVKRINRCGYCCTLLSKAFRGSTGIA